jgi:hypothetical protein
LRRFARRGGGFPLFLACAASPAWRGVPTPHPPCHAARGTRPAARARLRGFAGGAGFPTRPPCHAARGTKQLPARETGPRPQDGGRFRMG